MQGPPDPADMLVTATKPLRTLKKPGTDGCKKLSADEGPIGGEATANQATKTISLKEARDVRCPVAVAGKNLNACLAFNPPSQEAEVGDNRAEDVCGIVPNFGKPKPWHP